MQIFFARNKNKSVHLLSFGVILVSATKPRQQQQQQRKKTVTSFSVATLKCHHFLIRSLGLQIVNETRTVHICLLYNGLMYNSLVCMFLYVAIF
jgi:hypothetical protein